MGSREGVNHISMREEGVEILAICLEVWRRATVDFRQILTYDLEEEDGVTTNRVRKESPLFALLSDSALLPSICIFPRYVIYL